jgi:hypothetical protein
MYQLLGYGNCLSLQVTRMKNEFLFSYPEDGGNWFLRNVGTYLQKLHDVTPEKTVVLTVTAVRTSDLSDLFFLVSKTLILIGWACSSHSKDKHAETIIFCGETSWKAKREKCY